MTKRIIASLGTQSSLSSINSKLLPDKDVRTSPPLSSHWIYSILPSPSLKLNPSPPLSPYTQTLVPTTSAMELQFQQQRQHQQHQVPISKPTKFKGRSKSSSTTKFIGVRQRPSGRWVAEIKDTIQKIRVWLGTFDTAEDAARAYDEAACLLRGANTRTNFWPCSPSQPTGPPALPSKITNLLLTRLKARNNSGLEESQQQAVQQLQPVQRQLYETEENEGEDDIPFTDFINDPTESMSNLTHGNEGGGDHMCDYNGLHADCTEEGGGGEGEMELGCNLEEVGHFGECGEGVQEEEGDGDMGAMDFQFMDAVERSSSSFFSPFEMVEEMEEPIEQENGEDEPSMIRAAMKRMKYERKVSASLYALNGISECLRLKLEGKNGEELMTNHLSSLRNACRKQQEDEVKVVEGGVQVPVEDPHIQSQSESTSSRLCSSSSAASSSPPPPPPPPPPPSSSASTLSNDGELSLWSSLDLPPICFVA